MSVSDKKKESPTVVADVLIFSKNFSAGCLIFTLPLSTAVLNLRKVMELVLISSSTLGAVTCSSITEKGSNPARKAEVSKTRTRKRRLLFWISHPIPLNSNLLRSLR